MKAVCNLPDCLNRSVLHAANASECLLVLDASYELDASYDADPVLAFSALHFSSPLEEKDLSSFSITSLLSFDYCCWST